MTRVLLTGATGFVGRHVLRRILKDTDWDVVCPVRRASAHLVPSTARVDVVTHDTTHVFGPVDVVMNLASDTNIPGSIHNPRDSIRANVDMMVNVLEYARRVRPTLFLHMSTNEVYGPTGGEPHREWAPIHPESPYAAGKAAQEALAHAWWATYDLPVMIVNTMNPFGPGQPSGKFVPVCLDTIVDGGTVEIQSSPNGAPAARTYTYVENLADACVWLTRRYLADPLPVDEWSMPARYNVVGDMCLDNVAMFGALKYAVFATLGAGAFEALPPSGYTLADTPLRPGRDLHRALDGSRLAALGWRAPVSFRIAVAETVNHHLAMRSEP
jgi:dTDP-glucose 4,6-dehydratase